MALTFPTPPTAPTPPAVDKGDGNNSHAKIDAPNFFQVPFVQGGGVNFKNPATETFQGDEENFSENEVEEETPEQNSAVGKKQITTPETLARDAVANGAGALTKKTVTKPEQQNNSAPSANSANQNAIQIPSSSNSSLSDAERGKAVLREFQEEDRQLASEEKNNFGTSTETPKTFHLNQQQGQQGGLYWIVILLFAAVAGFVVVKKFLISDKPKLKKSDLFDDTKDRLKKLGRRKEELGMESNNSSLLTPTSSLKTKPARVPKKDDDDKGKHFEIRV